MLRCLQLKYPEVTKYISCLSNFLHRFAELLEKTFIIPFAFEMLVITIALSLTLLQIRVIYQLIHLFVLSLERQKLTDHSLQTRDKIFNSPWHKTSVRSQKLIMMVMTKCLRPSFLSAGKIYIFSLESFVLQVSMSYFTVLSSF
ncbi:Odorant receptor 378 [Nylanderia fulva]|uniref:Odorant receptor 378 n=1 Tax=Nylanderia fulva TaxID=613905 RepID=A0A6G1LRM8_9HYME|nr:Odorant receptor 378 [Nylanderia fulva]